MMIYGLFLEEPYDDPPICLGYFSSPIKAKAVAQAHFAAEAAEYWRPQPGKVLHPVLGQRPFLRTYVLWNAALDADPAAVEEERICLTAPNPLPVTPERTSDSRRILHDERSPRRCP
jgi:hypothetical protein